MEISSLYKNNKIIMFAIIIIILFISYYFYHQQYHDYEYRDNRCKEYAINKPESSELVLGKYNIYYYGCMQEYGWFK
jgi:hypothetical protein